MTTIDPYTIYSIQFFNFVQILTQIFVKNAAAISPRLPLSYIKEVYLQGTFTYNTLQKEFMNKTKFCFTHI